LSRPWRNAARPGEYCPEEFAMNAHKVLDELEQAIDRMRDMDPALKAWYLARLDELRKAVK
jgi:hypothetical protein